MRLLEHAGFFLLVSLITSLVIAAIRLETPRQIVRESLHFFVTIVIGIAVFCVIVYVVEWIFIRPLV